MRSPIRVLLADDHAIVRMGVASVLEMENDISVVGEAEDGREALALARKTAPDVVVMDLMMPVMDGVEATERIHAALPEAKIVLLTTFGTSDGIGHALESGATGAVLKSSAETELASAIRAVAAGKAYLSQDIARQLKANPPIQKLTDRQLEILAYMAKGRTSKSIADALGIAVSSVNDHIEAIVRKVGATNRTEAIAIALRKQLLKV